VDDFETWVEGEVTPTLNAFDNNGDTRATVLIFYGNRVDDIRIQGGVINTLQARMGTGGNNMPMLAYPIQDGRDMEKKQNGLGVGDENDPSYTLDRTGGQAVAYPIQGTVIGRSDTAGPQGKGYGNPDDPMFTIDTVGGHAVARVGNFELYDFPKEDVAPSLNARRAKDTLAYEDAVVRRLTPLECERLQGFPDGWTDSQSDSQRYKQMGNAVAVPVVQWIINRIVEVDNARPDAEPKE
jgi:DNA (cytosine-5)-methyltransferase 1